MKKVGRGNQKAVSKKPKSGSRPPDLKWETQLGYPQKTIIGVDEVGRGCLAGPVVAGALILPAVIDFERDSWLSEVADSKCLTPAKREELAPKIEAWAQDYGIGVASVEEIDSINIFHASHLAMVRAIQKAIGNGPRRELHALVDGKFLPKNLPCAATAIIKGDLQCLSIAAASILAKVWRDRRMAELDAVHPGYGFAVHKGYSTPQHSAALRKLGACVIHRRSFAPVTEEISRRANCNGLGSELLPQA